MAFYQARFTFSQPKTEEHGAAALYWARHAGELFKMKVGDIVMQTELPDYLGLITGMSEVTGREGWTVNFMHVRWINKLYEVEKIPEWRLEVVSPALL